ncbi:zinc cluster DNA-binding protein, putative [Cyberlindnera jadinii]|uniref:Zinc cluster DNA-binding protein, putative n=1 Tax=Cyberlindnera jadinii (strain ATCC 18201 / CBS 1600 / BCRC 20928 / JCM 3617 / NBRC 0987 / NRRL Y-1542) TaxID=983966 RepID=A0A0H5C4H1_CYBJN|nr:zinc cluster DNA-binding protein, putative [Cyberlindnera jadinii]
MEEKKVVCITCKEKRRKNPCLWCKKYNQPCSYNIDSDRRRRKYHTDYIDFLESKSHRLKEFITKFAKDDEELQQLVVEKLQELDSKELPQLKPVKDEIDGSVESVENSHLIEELMEATRNLRLDDEELKPNYVYNSFTSELQEKILENKAKFSSDVINSESSPLALVGYTLVFNDLSYQTSLVHLFEQKFAIHSMFFLKLLPVLWQCDYNSILDPGIRLLMNVVFGISSNFSSHPLAKVHGDYFIALARDSLMSVVCKSQTDTNIIAALHLLSCYEMGQNEPFQSYLLDSMACSLLQHMGLHISYDGQEDADGQTYAPKQTPFKAAALWSVCTHDRIITNVINVPSVIHFKRIVAPFYQIVSEPSDQIHFQELSFAYISRMWYIFDRFTDQIYSVHFDLGETNNRQKVMATAKKTFNELYSSLPSLLRLKSPKTLDLSDPNQTHILIFHLNYHYLKLQLNKIFIREASYELKSSILKEASKCGELIHTLVSQREVIDVDLLPYYLPNFVNTIVLVYLFILTTANTSTSTEVSDNEVSTFYFYFTQAKTLLQMLSINWKLAKSSLENLLKLETKFNLQPPLSSWSTFSPTVHSDVITPVTGTDVTPLSTTGGFLASTDSAFLDWFQEFPDFEQIKHSRQEIRQRKPAQQQPTQMYTNYPIPMSFETDTPMAPLSTEQAPSTYPIGDDMNEFEYHVDNLSNWE